MYFHVLLKNSPWDSERPVSPPSLGNFLGVMRLLMPENERTFLSEWNSNIVKNNFISFSLVRDVDDFLEDVNLEALPRSILQL
jgi:hypothetical protein